LLGKLGPFLGDLLEIFLWFATIPETQVNTRFDNGFETFVGLVEPTGLVILDTPVEEVLHLASGLLSAGFNLGELSLDSALFSWAARGRVQSIFEDLPGSDKVVLLGELVGSGNALAERGSLFQSMVSLYSEIVEPSLISRAKLGRLDLLESFLGGDVVPGINLLCGFVE
jgi:hypothetical protein